MKVRLRLPIASALATIAAAMLALAGCAAGPAETLASGTLLACRNLGPEQSAEAASRGSTGATRGKRGSGSAYVPPDPGTVSQWSSEAFVSALRHDPLNKNFNSGFRQLLHVGFKVAAKLGARYLALLSEFQAPISKNVTSNLFERHIKPVFLGS